MVLLIEVESMDELGQLLMRNQNTIFVKGAGNFGGPRSSSHSTPTYQPPSREPDCVSEYTTSADQAALYRLSGDLNPLHIDPDFAGVGGFDQPILHGLCSYGIAVRHVVEAFCEGDPQQVLEIKARFSSPVLPGQTLRTLMWKEGQLILFKCQVAETAGTCLSGGWVKIGPVQALSKL